MKTINGSNYQKHPHYPAIARAVAEILKTSTVVSPVEVLLRLERITKRNMRIRASAGFPIWSASASEIFRS